MEKTDIVILCGGLGTRLRKVVSDVPKPLADINGRPFLDILLSWINKNNHIGNVIIAAGYMGEKIKNKYRSHKFKYNLKTIIEDKPLGTGGAVRNALEHIKSKNFVVLNGDSFINESLDSIINFHNSENSTASIVIKYSDEVERYGLVSLDKSKKKLLKFSEKETNSKFGYINCGLYILNKLLAEKYFVEDIFSLEEKFQKILPAIDTHCFVSEANFIDIGTVKSYKESQIFFS